MLQILKSTVSKNPESIYRLLNKRLRTFKRRFSVEVETKRRKKEWESVIGIEIHAQISSSSKLFSSSGINFHSITNQQVSTFDAALPGTLPVLNRRCVEAAVLTSLALKAEVNKISHFDRKHYFYADLPAGYQITQQRKPIATNGLIDFVVFNPSKYKKPYQHTAFITQLQLEQDSGKSLHDNHANHTLIDLNRAGIGLIEIVFAPNLRDGEEAACLIKELISILKSLETCSCKMEEGALRVDANVSVNRPGEAFGIRSEVKNINSIRGVFNAIEYEIERQIKIKENGGSVLNETRSYDPQTKTTKPMRDKEVLQDYRYMPEPNLPPLRLCDNSDTHLDSSYINIDSLRAKLSALPNEMRNHLMDKYNLPLEQAAIIVDIGIYDIFVDILKTSTRSSELVTNFLLQDFLAELNDRELNVDCCGIKSDQIGEIIDMLHDKVITKSTAKDILKMLFDGEIKNPKRIIEEKDLGQIQSFDVLAIICDKVIEENVRQVKKYKSGKSKAINSLIGEIKKKTNGKANMKLAIEILTKKLDS